MMAWRRVSGFRGSDFYFRASSHPPPLLKEALASLCIALRLSHDSVPYPEARDGRVSYMTVLRLSLALTITEK